MPSLLDSYDDPSFEDARDDLISNGMFPEASPEKRLIACLHTRTSCNTLIRRELMRSPDTAYIVEGKTGCYFVSQVWYEVISGSNRDTADHPGELASYFSAVSDWLIAGGVI
jgi:hypothetical protein